MPKKSSKKTIGVCKLTGRTGEFVKSHIFPRALTKPVVPGKPLIGMAPGKRPSRHWDSWYDDGIVILKGEQILASLDNWAIKELRIRQLIWSGWRTAELQAADHKRFGDTPYGIRIMTGVDVAQLRLFFLSLLWRSAVSSQRDFQCVELPSSDVSQLGRMLRESDPGFHTFYPMSLVQLSTRGPFHNMAPVVRTTVIPASENHPEYKLPHYRFYLDGLIAHIYCAPFNGAATKSLGDLVLGASDELGIVTVASDVSFQAESFNLAMHEVTRNWSEVMERLSR